VYKKILMEILYLNAPLCWFIHASATTRNGAVLVWGLYTDNYL
jgi:hypothetical protein